MPQKKVTKAIIPVAGLGTRFLPATKAQPKEMLAVVDKPVIQYIVEEVVASGITDIIFITGRGKRAIEDHFDNAPELQASLKQNNKHEASLLVKNIAEMARFTYVRQPKPLGDGDAVLCARHLAGDEPVAVLFGDDIVDSKVPALKQIIDAFDKKQGPVIGMEEVPQEKVGLYGVLDTELIEDRLYRVKDLIEKPDPDKAPSNHVVLGRFIITPAVFEALGRIKKSSGEELRLVDALEETLRQEETYSVMIDGTRHDCGSKLGFLKASIELGLQHEEVGEEFKKYLQGLDL